MHKRLILIIFKVLLVIYIQYKQLYSIQMITLKFLLCQNMMEYLFGNFLEILKQITPQLTWPVKIFQIELRKTNKKIMNNYNHFQKEFVMESILVFLINYLIN